MELDTGAAVSIISERQLRRILPHINLQPSKTMLTTYSGEKASCGWGTSRNTVCWAKRNSISCCCCSERTQRDWLKCLNLTGRRLEPSISPRSSSILTWRKSLYHEAVFKSESGTIHPYRARLQVQQGATPRFCKARLPCTIRDSLDKELIFESSGIIQSVFIVIGQHLS